MPNISEGDFVSKISQHAQITKNYCLMKAITAYILCLLIGFFGALHAQTTDNLQSPAAEYVAALRSGGLIVRLPSQRNKIEAMRTFRDTAQLNELSKQRLTASISKLEQETRESNLSLIRSFRQYYELTPVQFLYDTAVSHLLAGRLQGHFIDDSLRAIPDKSVPEQGFLSLRIGYTDPGDYSGAEALILGDARWVDVRPPFPTAVAFNNASYFVGQWLNPSTASHRRHQKAIDRLSKKLYAAMNRWR